MLKNPQDRRARRTAVQVKEVMPFTEHQVRRNYHIPKETDSDLQDILEFIAMGYSRFYLQILTDKTRNIREEAELCARLANACLQTAFQRKEISS